MQPSTSLWLAVLVAIGAPARAAGFDRSRCTLEDTGRGAPQTVDLELVGVEWGGWEAYCDRLGSYLRDGAELGGARGYAAWLAETRLFATTSCRFLSRDHLSCQLEALPVVREIDLGGELPFPLRASVVEKRLGIAIGTPLTRVEEGQGEITGRLVRYLERNGFWGATVTLTTEPVGGAEPQEGYRLVAELDGLGKYDLGEVDVAGDPLLTRETAREILTHNWLPGLFSRRVRLAQVRDDTEAMAELLRARRWPAVRVRSVHQINNLSGKLDFLITIHAGVELAVSFRGNQAVPSEELRALLPFAAARKADRSSVRAALELLRTHFQRQGFHEARVTVEEDRSHSSRLALAFTIEQGPRSELSRVDIVGPADPSAADVELQSTPSGCLSTGRWVDADVELDRRRLDQRLRDAGYGQAEVLVEKWVPAAGELGLRFRVEEGLRQTLASLTIEGLPEDLDAEDAQEAVGLDPGAGLNDRVLADAGERLGAWLLSRGYPAASVAQRTAPRAAGGVALTLVVDPGEHLTFGGVLFSGSYETSSFLLDADLGLEAGDPLDLDDLVQFKRRLRQRDLFASIRVGSVVGAEQRRWLLTEVEENASVSLDLLLAFSTDNLFGVGVDFRHKNLFGLGLVLESSLRLANSPGLISPWLRIGYTDSASVRLRAPRVLGLPVTVELSGTFEHHDKPTFIETRGGGALTFSHTWLDPEGCRWCPVVSVALSYEITAAKTEPRVPAIGPPVGLVVVPRVTPKLGISQLDSVTDPRRGYALVTQLELGHPIGGRESTALWRYGATLTTYFALGDPVLSHFQAGPPSAARVVVALRASYGHGEPIAPYTELPASEALFYGGDNSVRGLPERVSLRLVPDGRDLFAATAELRWYFWDDLWIGDLQLAAFCDLGMVSGPGGPPLGVTSLSVGPMLRYTTVVGPLAIGYGIPVVRPPGSGGIIPPEGRIHVTFGAAF